MRLLWRLISGLLRLIWRTLRTVWITVIVLVLLVSMAVNVDGTVSLQEGNPDIGGSRASISLMAAEELGIGYDKIRTIVADTASLGHNDITDGSRVTFAVGLATNHAARDAIQKMCVRAARMSRLPCVVITQFWHPQVSAEARAESIRQRRQQQEAT